MQNTLFSDFPVPLINSTPQRAWCPNSLDLTYSWEACGNKEVAIWLLNPNPAAPPPPSPLLLHAHTHSSCVPTGKRRNQGDVPCGNLIEGLHVHIHPHMLFWVTLMAAEHMLTGPRACEIALPVNTQAHECTHDPTSTCIPLITRSHLHHPIPHWIPVLGQNLIRQCSVVVKCIHSSSWLLDLNPGSAIYQLCDFGQIHSPLCASISPSANGSNKQHLLPESVTRNFVHIVHGEQPLSDIVSFIQ